jgi:exonuclease SbcC
MIPLDLYVSGFLSYQDPVELDFTAIELACIAGSNGAGKSALLDAITWVLFGQARKRDDSLINAQSPAADRAIRLRCWNFTFSSSHQS